MSRRDRVYANPTPSISRATSSVPPRDASANPSPDSRQMYIEENMKTAIAEFRDKNTDPYKILGISRDANENVIKEAYREKAKEWHPDRNLHRKEEAEKEFKEVVRAKEVLDMMKESPEAKDMFNNAFPSQESPRVRSSN